MRRRTVPLAVALVLVLGALLAGCGDEGRSSSPLDAALGYLPTGAGAVLVIDTDRGGGQLRTFDRKLAPRLFGDGLAEVLRRTFADGSELSFDRDVKRELGNPLVVSFEPRLAVAGGLSKAEPLAAIKVTDAERVRELLHDDGAVRPAGQVYGTDVFRRRGGWMLTVDGDVLLVARSRGRLARALAQRDEQDRLTERRFERALSGLPRRAFVRGYGGLQPLLGRPELERFQDVNWVSALQSFALAASFDRRDRLRVEVGLNTDPNELKATDLPVAAGDDPPPLTDRQGEVAGASAGPGQTGLFVLRALRVLFPRSRLVRDIRRLEARLGIDFERDLVGRFDGPSASSLGPGGAFAARSRVSRPERLERTLARLAPSVGRLKADLDRLRAPGLGLLLLLAPDAPVAQGVAGSTRVRARRLRGERSLYRLSGLGGRGRGRPRLYFGVEGDQFVVSTSPARARAIAGEPAKRPGGATGSVVVRADGRELRRPLARGLGLEGAAVGEILGSLSASRGGVRATLQVELP